MKKLIVAGLIAVIIIVVWLFVPRMTQEKINIQATSKTEPVLLVSPKLTNRPTTPPTLVPNQTKSVLFDVPFIVQAPRHNWKDPVYQNACEEASILMAMRWVEGKSLTSEEAFVEIQKISDYSKAHYGFYLDQSAEDLAKLMRDYFKYPNVRYQANIQTVDIKAELFKGNLVLVPVNGQKLGNPYFTQPGPTEHMLVIKGYDVGTGEFITNDPGIGKGNGYRYKEKILFEAIRKYPSGYKEEIIKIEKVMIVVERTE
ncbi:MAG: C39 family peptidase [bacterium]|nr:C39 family peptidase [bacterium]